MGIPKSQDTIPQALTRLGRGSSSRGFQVEFKGTSRRLPQEFKCDSRRFEGGWRSFLRFWWEEMLEKFEPYQASNQSRMEPWRTQIEKMRQLNWPYRKVADWLEENCELKVSLQAVHQFCKVRKIRKGEVASEHPTPTRLKKTKTTVVSPSRRSNKSRGQKLFEYECEGQPIDLSNLKPQS